MKIELLAVGRLRKGPELDLIEDYRKRLGWPFTLTELESKHKDEARMHAEELVLLKARLAPTSFVVALDERGKTMASRELAGLFSDLQVQNRAQVQFVIGGANGLDDELRKRADLLLSFGRLTWPHMLARVMLLEQIYRCQQIQKNHPYHRD
jgi:23S rRNA (pseudouridine1915-N3)-methyltransferase